MDELVVDKNVMHKKCFVCSHCKRQLSLGNFTLANNMLFCKVHYIELFKTSGGKYEQAFGDAGFEKKAERSYTPPPAAARTLDRRDSSGSPRPASTGGLSPESPPQPEKRSPMQQQAVAGGSSPSPKSNLAKFTTA